MLLDGEEFDCPEESSNLCNSYEAMYFIGECDPSISMSLFVLIVFTVGFLALSAISVSVMSHRRRVRFRLHSRKLVVERADTIGHGAHAQDVDPNNPMQVLGGTHAAPGAKQSLLSRLDRNADMVRFRQGGLLLPLNEVAGRWRMAFNLLAALRSAGKLDDFVFSNAFIDDDDLGGGGTLASNPSEEVPSRTALAHAATWVIPAKLRVEASWSLVCARFRQSIEQSRELNARRHNIFAALHTDVAETEWALEDHSLSPEESAPRSPQHHSASLSSTQLHDRVIVHCQNSADN